MQPFGRAHLGAIGDGINMAARLLAHACASEIVVSNGFYQGLSQDAQSDLAETAPIDARNIGRIKAWKLTL
jgi:class 3 adenylate cyclase